MNNQDEKLERFIDDAIFLETNKLKIECGLKTLKAKEKKEKERSQYRFSKREIKLSGVIWSLVIFAIVMLLVHFIVVPLLHFIIIDLIISLFQGFRTMPPCKPFDVVCDVIIGVALFIPVFGILLQFFGEKLIELSEIKEKNIHDETEDNRLQHFNEVIIPKIRDEENKLQEEYDTYDLELQKLYGIGLVPEEYCNLEALYIMKQYIIKYKTKDKKSLLNACDKYFQYKDLKQNVQNAQERLEDAQMRIIDSFEDVAYSMESQMDSLMMKIESQNYDLERLQERTEREKRNSELLLYWNLID